MGFSDFCLGVSRGRVRVIGNSNVFGVSNGRTVMLSWNVGDTLGIELDMGRNRELVVDMLS